MTVFAKGAWFALEDMANVNCRTVGLDWNMSAQNVKEILPNKTLQGNLDPCALYGSFDDVKRES